MSDQKREPFDQLVKSVLDVIDIDQQEINRLRADRDEWKNLYFKQAERLDRIETTLRGVENNTEETDKAISWLLGSAIVHLVLLSGIVIRMVFYGGGQ